MIENKAVKIIYKNVVYYFTKPYFLRNENRHFRPCVNGSQLTWNISAKEKISYNQIKNICQKKIQK